MDSLDISYEDLIEIPEIKTRLTQFDCSHNQINSTKGLESQSLLQSIDFSYNKIIQIHGWVFLANLTVLNLSHNMLESIQGLHQCYGLTTILLQFNNLKKLAGLETLRNLQYLNASNNLISEKTVIRTLSLNSKLEVLYLEGNRIIDYRQLCYSVILSLVVLDGIPTPGRGRKGSVKDSYMLRKLRSNAN